MASRSNQSGLLYNEFWLDTGRQFDPSTSPLYRNIPERDLAYYDPRKSVTHLRTESQITGRIRPDRHSIVLSIDGACRNNGMPSALASWAVYYGDRSRYNVYGFVHYSIPQTSTRAKIEALSMALRGLQKDYCEDVSVKNCCIQTDSEYLVMAISDWIYDWMANYGRNSRGRPVRHFQALMDIHKQIDDLGNGNENRRALNVKLWHIPREWNREADELANLAFDD